MRSTRRACLTSLGAILVPGSVLAGDPNTSGLSAELAQIEAKVGGPLGVAVHGTAS